VKKILALLVLAGFLATAVTAVTGCDDKKTTSSKTTK